MNLSSPPERDLPEAWGLQDREEIFAQPSNSSNKQMNFRRT